MDGFFSWHSHQRAFSGKTEGLALLAKKGNMEIMTQRIGESATAWLSPGDREDNFEFFYVHEGILEAVFQNNEVETFHPGDSFFAAGLKESVMLRCVKKALLVYVANTPIFDDEAYWQQKLKELTLRIDEKDHYTRRHSHAVMNYSIQLYRQLTDHCPGLSLNDYVVAALFHDVGKCNVPGEILRKPTRLTPEEYEIVKRHPADSAKILEPYFGPRIAALTRMHHERMDGSGYPDGLKGDEIPFEARILMVADAFDAITSKRAYNKTRTMEDAAEELCSLTEQYDPIVTQTLMRLVREGNIIPDDDPGASLT